MESVPGVAKSGVLRAVGSAGVVPAMVGKKSGVLSARAGASPDIGFEAELSCVLRARQNKPRTDQNTQEPPRLFVVPRGVRAGLLHICKMNDPEPSGVKQKIRGTLSRLGVPLKIYWSFSDLLEQCRSGKTR